MRLRGYQIASHIQILNSSGVPVTNATVNFKVFGPDGDGAWEQKSTGIATHISDGLYMAFFFPDEIGTWLIYFYCGDPIVHESFSYPIGDLRADGFKSGSTSYGNPYVHPNDTSEHTIIDLNSEYLTDYVLYLDLSELTQDCVIRHYIDFEYGGKGLQLVEAWDFPDDFCSGCKVIKLKIDATIKADDNGKHSFTIQSASPEGATRTLPAFYVTTYSSIDTILGLQFPYDWDGLYED